MDENVNKMLVAVVSDLRQKSSCQKNIIHTRFETFSEKEKNIVASVKSILFRLCLSEF